MESKKDLIIVYCLWLIATLATLGSLFFSEIMKFTPCTLCWYQRIAMYPLVVILLVGSFSSKKITFDFSIIFIFLGWLIAGCHNLLHYKIIPESAAPCVAGVPCSTIYINWFGFLTIPMLSFFAFSTLLGGIFYLKRSNNG